MTQYGWTDRYLTRDGRPWLPVMGEFHFSRYPCRYWKEELEKMKAGGVEIVSTYLFWNHHEERPGEIRWDPSKPNGTPRKLLDVSKATALGWTYRTELEDGIRLSYQDFLNNPIRAER